MNAKWELVRIGQEYSVRFAGKEAGTMGRVLLERGLTIHPKTAEYQAEELERLLNKMCPEGPTQEAK